ncbi:fructosyl amine: oxygen oxidoreductase [Aspergillus heteromorphus CBS 117.55]|uniref:Fructosyl amine: oxygen oxidoreductase n=1 Tax=Aspergillus heteromorphus CBS 117.55 TaxID=1448321 RepID=A0A317V9P7_9EURO|nr:fructosyl amine: oxygen oxidoreductase [Aspergillus heteromorphus CBS 117.55]PWY70916.1 fructosyl amine: oxygen oxidoreductase [Aspergillus heteromorphus CBS 117.55]
MTITTSSSMLIIGAGTWGCSTALHLARRGYTNVTVLDPYPVPSAISAGNDVNKIISSGQYSNRKDEIEVNELLGEQAFQGWKNDPLFQPYYHDVGLLMSASTPAGLDRLGVRVRPEEDPNLVEMSRPEQFRDLAPAVLKGDFPGWKGYFLRSGAGWAHARNALVAAAREAQRLGVKFVAGSPAGKVITLIFENDDVRGAVTEDGKIWHADQTILCAGANAGQFLDFKDQLRPTAWTLVHITLDPEERKLYKDIPVIFNIEKGFFFEPDEERGEIKICDEHPGYTNMVRSSDGSVQGLPFEKTQVPLESEARVRALLRETVPQLADRPFSFARICWCADTANREFIIDRHPQHQSLILGCGASGRGYKYLPSIGGLIVDAMEGKVPPKVHELIKWSPEVASNRNWNDTLGRFGGPNRVMDFQEVKEWTKVPHRDISKL